MMFLLITLLICLILFVYILFSDNLRFINIKIKNIEEKINSTLINRKALILESEKIIKEVLKTKKQIYDGIDDLSNKNISMMELDRKLLIYINEFHLINDKYKKLKNHDEFQKIVYRIEETQELLNAYKDYYNNVASKYNKLISIFPVNIISFIKRRKQKSFFDKKSLNDQDYNEFKY